MLTWEETREALGSAMVTSPDEFVRQLADYMPQGVIDNLMKSMYNARMSEHENEERAEQETIAFMVGFHLAWILALKVLK